MTKFKLFWNKRVAFFGTTGRSIAFIPPPHKHPVRALEGGVYFVNGQFSPDPVSRNQVFSDQTLIIRTNTLQLNPW